MKKPSKSHFTWDLLGQRSATPGTRSKSGTPEGLHGTQSDSMREQILSSEDKFTFKSISDFLLFHFYLPVTGKRRRRYA